MIVQDGVRFSVANYLGPNSSAMDRFVQQLEIEVSQLSGLLDLKLSKRESYEQIIRHARQLSQNRSLLEQDMFPHRIQQALSAAKIGLVCIERDSRADMEAIFHTA